MIGKTILKYRILEKIDQGGMGIVYKAEDTRLQRLVAIKFLLRELGSDLAAREQFHVEAQAAAALNHPNIATIHDLEEVDEELFIVMEYLEGRELREIVRAHRHAPLAFAQILDYALQIAHGLRETHQNGLVHRDLNSANILITKQGQVKILDFGLAKKNGHCEGCTDEQILGTAGYMSPEQVRADEVNHQTDIWSLGVVIYEMVTSERPFAGHYVQEVFHSILYDEPQPVKSLRQQVPTAIGEIVSKALRKRRRDRYQSVGEMIADLGSVRSNGRTNNLNAKA